jgi:hypothetical protein
MKMLPEENAMNNHTNLRQDFWSRQLLQEVPLLRELRDIVLACNATTKRFPKWKFRIGEDFVIQLQPRGELPTRTTSRLFMGVAIQGQPIPAEAFTRHISGLLQLSFEIVKCQGNSAWEFRPTWRYVKSEAVAMVLRERTRESLSFLNQLDAATMFLPACLVCGKKLTDPISMARWIGPECAQRAPFDARKRRILTEPAERAA